MPSGYHPAMRLRLLAVLAACTLACAARAEDYTRYLGSWSGPFLLYVADPDTGSQGSSMVYTGTLKIDADGTVRGGIADIGCVFSGSSADYLSPVNATIDLMASGCTDMRFNGHFVGKLIENPPLKYGSLRLRSMRSLDAGVAQISAIVRH